MTYRKVFVSHAADDKSIATAFVDTLILGGLDRGQLFYTSARATGVRTGEPFADRIRRELADAALVIQLITETFLSRHYCVAEAGAQWVLQTPSFPIVVPPLGVGDVTGVFAGLHTTPLDSRDTFDELHGVLSTVVDAKLPLQQWAPAVEQFLTRLPQLLGGAVDRHQRDDFAYTRTRGARATVSPTPPVVPQSGPREWFSVEADEEGVTVRAVARLAIESDVARLDRIARTRLIAEADGSSMRAAITELGAKRGGVKNTTDWALENGGVNSRYAAVYRLCLSRAFKPGLAAVSRVMLSLPGMLSPEIRVAAEHTVNTDGKRLPFSAIAHLGWSALEAAAIALPRAVEALTPGTPTVTAAELFVTPRGARDDVYGNSTPPTVEAVVDCAPLGEHIGEQGIEWRWVGRVDAENVNAADWAQEKVGEALVEAALDHGYLDAVDTVPPLINAGA